MPSRAAASRGARPSSPRRSATGARAAARAGRGRLPRYTWRDAYAELRDELDDARPPARRRVPRARRREPARRPRGGRALRRRLLRQEHDADHASARLVGRARHARHRRRARADAAARRRLRLVHALHRRVPDGRARRARRRSTRRGASRTGRRRREPIPSEYRARARRRRSTAATSARTCARGTAGREATRRRAAPERRARTSTSSSGSRRTAPSSSRSFDRLYVPAQRPALAAAERARRARERRRRGARPPRRARAVRGGDDELLAEHAAWALARIGRSAHDGTRDRLARAVDRASSGSLAVPFAIAPGRAHDELSAPGTRTGPGVTTSRVHRRRRRRSSSAVARPRTARGARAQRPALVFDFASSPAFALALRLRGRHADARQLLFLASSRARCASGSSAASRPRAATVAGRCVVRAAARRPLRRAVPPVDFVIVPARRRAPDRAARRLARRAARRASGDAPRRGRARRRPSATSSAGAPTCSTRPTAARAR